MIKFDPTKLTLEYVYIRKIFKNFIEVICDNERNVYESDNIDFKRLKNNSVQIPIHYKVYSLYLKRNSLLHFDEELGKKACIVYYDGKVLTVDVYRKSYFVKNENEESWKSVNESVFSTIVSMLEINQDVFIDGKSIFFLDKLAPIERFNSTNLFWLQPVRFIELSKMGVKKFSSKLLSDMKDDDKQKDNQDNNVKKDENDSLVILKSGLCLAFNPNADKPEEEQIFVYSSSLDTTVLKNNGKKYNDENKIQTNKAISILKSIEDKENQSLLNLDFALKASRVIGEHYSFEDTEFLEIPKIILETGILNLKYDISRESRAKFPISIEPFEGLAYIMRYFYIEKDLNVYRDLVSLFDFTIRYGFVSKKSTGDVFLEGKNHTDINRIDVKKHLKELKQKVKTFELNH